MNLKSLVFDSTSFASGVFPAAFVDSFPLSTIDDAFQAEVYFLKKETDVSESLHFLDLHLKNISSGVTPPYCLSSVMDVSTYPDVSNVYKEFLNYNREALGAVVFNSDSPEFISVEDLHEIFLIFLRRSLQSFFEPPHSLIK